MLGFIGLQRALFTRFHHDIRYGMKSLLNGERRRCRSNQACKRVAVPELRDVPRYTGMLGKHLRSITEPSEQPACELTSRLQTIDEVVSPRNRFVVRATAESESMAEESARTIAENRDLIARREAFIQRRIEESQADAERGAAAVRETKSLQTLVDLIHHVTDAWSRIVAFLHAHKPAGGRWAFTG
ncbi:hypothetical protein [Aromatoleum evansii]|uniref:hypothetical protein n=1 Tax=Aromatoleum evansii TaxID=59406 RepID=UPI00145D2532|nr:hypothetical protein [Aromatoleum evansii]NMG31618.1 hypothetical protein [Aromatoleum evansii]